MKKLFLVLTVVLIAVVGCTSPPTHSTPEAKPEAVVTALYEAFNAGDVHAVKALYADDAVVHFPDWDETNTGAEEIHPWVEALVADNFAVEVKSLQVEGDTVTATFSAWADPSRGLGIAPLAATDVYTVKDGKIASQTSTLTEESSAKLMAAMAAAQSTSVITALADAFNVGDVAAVTALYTDDAVVNLIDWDETYAGAEEIRAWVEELVALHFAIEYEMPTVEGGTVSARGKVWADPTRELGIAPLVTTDVFTVKDGRITSQTSTLTEESLADLQAAMASQPSAVVMAYAEAINASDLEAAMALCHEEMYADLNPTLLPGFPNLSGGKEDVRAWLEEVMTLNLEIETEILSVAGDTVTAKSKAWSDYLRTLDAAPIVVNEVIKARDGQVWSWNRTIPESSLEKLQEGLAHSGISATITPEPGEVLASVSSDIVGTWTYYLGGVPGPVEFNRDGGFCIRDARGAIGDRAQFRFDGELLLIETKNPGAIAYCGSGIGSYVVFLTREGDKTVGLRFHEILDLCDLRSEVLTEEALTIEGP
jgi:ketosteroid isomerase-like protein